MNLILLLGIVIALYIVYAHFYKFKGFRKLKKGSAAPDFTLLNQNNQAISLHDFKGKKVVVYFFPKSDTPGCTKEACSIRDSYGIYQRNNIEVLGISYDKPEMLKEFQEKYHIPFTFLSDENHEVAKKYGAYQSFVNALFPARITFLINEQGRLVAILRKINVTTHGEDILKAFGIPSYR